MPKFTVTQMLWSTASDFSVSMIKKTISIVISWMLRKEKKKA